VFSVLTYIYMKYQVQIIIMFPNHSLFPSLLVLEVSPFNMMTRKQHCSSYVCEE